MKRLLLITVVGLFVAGQAFAQQIGDGGTIGVFTSGTGANCALLQAAAVSNYYIVHKLHNGTTGSSFAAPLPECATSYMFWVADQPQFPVYIANDTLGTQGGGVSVGYGSCVPAGTNVHVVTMVFNRLALLPGCCLMTVQPNLAFAPTPISTLCDAQGTEVPATAGSGRIRPTGTQAALCPCDIPVTPSTWGVIKELFRKG
jgi:hypothetical protein